MEKNKKTPASEYSKARETYRAEAKERYGATKEYAESERREAARTDGDRDAIQREMDEIFAAFGALVGTDPAAPAAQALVARWQDHISRHHYPCTDAILSGLAEMYIGDPRFTENLDRNGAGTAQLMHDAIKVHCG